MPHVESGDDEYYGYGVWIKKTEAKIFKYHIMGYDPGVSFHSAYYPESNSILVVCSNASSGAFQVMQKVEAILEGES